MIGATCLGGEGGIVILLTRLLVCVLCVVLDIHQASGVCSQQFAG